MSETVHTAIAFALVSGIVMAFVGVFFAKTALELMGTPDDVIRLSALYMRLYFCGMPFFMLYNYGAAILRAIGDTKRPAALPYHSRNRKCGFEFNISRCISSWCGRSCYWNNSFTTDFQHFSGPVLM